MRKEKIFGGVLILLLICVFFVGSGAAADDPIVGTWSGDTSIPFIGSYDVKLVCYENNTAQLTGYVDAFGYESSVNEPNLTWRNDGNGQYTGAGYGSQSLSLYLEGDRLTAIINPVKLGVLDSAIANRNFTVYLYNAPAASPMISAGRFAIQVGGLLG